MIFLFSAFLPKQSTKYKNSVILVGGGGDKKYAVGNAIVMIKVDKNNLKSDQSKVSLQECPNSVTAMEQAGGIVVAFNSNIATYEISFECIDKKRHSVDENSSSFATLAHICSSQHSAKFQNLYVSCIF